MPYAAKSFHQRENQPAERRGSAASRGYNHRWRKASKAWLAIPENRYCVQCKQQGRQKFADVVDHKIPHRGKQDLFWDPGNWQPLCYCHHNRKTASGA
jgi:5-methylcytosine-specific restriction protein A